MMMNWKSMNIYASLCAIAILTLGSCTKSDYTKMVLSELEKGERKDSLLLGIKFGDSREQFFGRCFDLNKMKLVTQGPSNNAVQYIFMDSLVHEKPEQIRLLFFPGFDDKNIISHIDYEFSYSAWAPWNKQYQADRLKIKVMELLKHWYKGNDFVDAEVKGEKIPVKVDGNRRILVFEKDRQTVLVRIQDILHPNFKHSID
jgi:hypothetical protein